MIDKIQRDQIVRDDYEKMCRTLDISPMSRTRWDSGNFEVEETGPLTLEQKICSVYLFISTIGCYELWFHPAWAFVTPFIRRIFS